MFRQIFEFSSLRKSVETNTKINDIANLTTKEFTFSRIAWDPNFVVIFGAPVFEHVLHINLKQGYDKYEGHSKSYKTNLKKKI